ncbi:MAG TPA: FAD-dependent oxidoreductase [Candidatus Cybelea sp.]|nr:FAD-dependent oxidoreductase [Candidatus Cybelea sp.]
MFRDPRYDLLFEPVKIGPVTAKNRFFQVPHCNGMGHHNPEGHAAMRGVKAEGGWAVVSTEEVEIHHSGDVSPYIEGRLWDDRDIPGHALMCEAVHKHGALAAIELTHNGTSVSNLSSREPAIGPSHQMTNYYPWQARAMDLEDIRAYRRWHRAAALRAKRAGFDIVYVYAAHDLSIALHFLQRRRNRRTDEYGGPLENRVRLLRELIEDTKEAIGDTCAVAVRFAVDEKMGTDGLLHDGEARDVIGLLAELPDLWDVNVSPWRHDSAVSRFSEEGHQDHYIAFVKQLTTKPVVGVGRYTSPDRMVQLIKRGVLDFIGAARPSIADPFLPRKIEQGRPDDIRECIGCNICVSGDMTMSAIRCTQNPTMGEEWRKGWHPEIIPAKQSNDRILVVGAGPAGLEAARALGQRGYEVHLAEATAELGGRVNKESKLPGLAVWARVRDYRIHQLSKLHSVEIYRDSHLSAEQILDFGFERVVLATGARWRRDGVGRSHWKPVPGLDGAHSFSPDDVMDGRLPARDPVLVFDDDHYYMGSLVAERLAGEGRSVTLVTTGDVVASWTSNTLELIPINTQLRRLGVTVITAHSLVSFDGEEVLLASNYGEPERRQPARAVVSVTSRLPEEALYRELVADPERLVAAGITSVTRIGDCLAPGFIAHAVYSGHRYARELDAPEIGDAVPFKRVVYGTVWS